MFLLRTVEEKDAAGPVAEVYNVFAKAGAVPLPLQLLSASPRLLELQFASIGYFMGHPALSVPLLAAIRYVAAGLSCHEACLDFNGKLLRRLGMEKEDVAQLEAGGVPASLEEREAALLAFVRKALAEPERVEAADMEALRGQGWTDADILDAVAHGVNLMASSALFRAFRRA